MQPIQIIVITTFAVAAVIMCFFRRMPCMLVAYFGYLLGGILGAYHVPVSQYFIWGIIAAADTCNIYMTRMDAPSAMRIYTVVGCLAGCIVGAVAATLTAVLVGGAIGGAAGFFAYTRTPRGRSDAPLSHQLSLFANCACSPWFTFTIIITTYSLLLYPTA